jgi:hypothetical protein
MSNTQSQTPPKTQHRKLKRWATWSHRSHQKPMIGNTESRTPPKTQHRKLKRWATRSHGPHQNYNTESKRDEQHRVTDPTKNTTQKTKEISNTESRTPPKTQHRKLKRWATRSHGTPPKTGDEQHGVTDPTKNTTQKNKEISNTQSRTPPKIQHRKQKRWATQSHGPHQKHNTEN